MSGAPSTLDMASILKDRSNRVVVCCGAGGVGKTTTAAAMALRAAATSPSRFRSTPRCPASCTR